MKQPRLIRWLTAAATAIVVVTLIAVLALNADNDSVHQNTGINPQATADATLHPAATESPDRLMEMERNGELHTMLQQHQQMMLRMQASASPQMLEIMRNDPMWQMLESGEMIDLMEQHQADISQMLAQPGQ